MLHREHRGYVVNGLIGSLTQTALHLLVRDESADQLGRREVMLPLLLEMVEQGRVGMKTGWRFLQLPGPAYQQPDFLSDRSETGSPYTHLATAIIHRAALIAAKGIAEPEDIDAVHSFLDRAEQERLQGE